MRNYHFSFKSIVSYLLSPVIILIAVFFAHYSMSLVILFAIAVLQIILSAKFKTVMAFQEVGLSYFKRSSCTKKEFKNLVVLNFLFNLSKVLLVMAFLRVFYLKFDLVNSLSESFKVFSLFVVLIRVLTLYFKKDASIAKKILQFLSFITYLAIIIFIYSFFTNTLAWCVFALVFIWEVLLKGYEEVLAGIRSLDFKKLAFLAIIFFLAIGSSMEEVAKFLIKSVEFFWKMDTSLSLPILIMLVVIIATVIIVSSVRSYLEKKKDEMKRLRYEERRKEDNLKMQEKFDKISKKMREIELSLQAGSITKENLIYLVEQKKFINFEISWKFLESLNWEEFFTISHIKKHIIWEFEDISIVLTFLSQSYAKTYVDTELELIYDSIARLKQLLHKHEDYIGFNTAIKLVKQYSEGIKKK